MNPPGRVDETINFSESKPPDEKQETATKTNEYEGLDSDEKIQAYVNSLFEKLDKNKDSQLDFDELKPYLNQYLKDEYEIEPSQNMLEEQFLALRGNGTGKSKEALFEFVKEIIEMKD